MESTNQNTEKKEKFQRNYFDDYLEIMKVSTGDFISVTQWKSNGDQFEKLSMYEEYTPVQTSSNTTSN